RTAHISSWLGKLWACSRDRLRRSAARRMLRLPGRVRISLVCCTDETDAGAPAKSLILNGAKLRRSEGFSVYPESGNFVASLSTSTTPGGIGKELSSAPTILPACASSAASDARKAAIWSSSSTERLQSCNFALNVLNSLMDIWRGLPAFAPLEEGLKGRGGG